MIFCIHIIYTLKVQYLLLLTVFRLPEKEFPLLQWGIVFGLPGCQSVHCQDLKATTRGLRVSETPVRHERRSWWWIQPKDVLFSPDSEAMGFLFQITMSCSCVLSRQVAGAGAGCRCWCCELAVHAGAVSWLPTWWRQVAGAGAGCWVPVLAVETGCRVPVLVVPGAGAGAGAVSWLCTWWKQVAGAGAGAGCRVPLVVPAAGAVSWLCTWWREVAGAGCRAPVRVLVL